MADAQAHHALRAKVAELEGLIRTYEQGLDKARHNLAVINSAVLILGTKTGLPSNYVPGASVRHLFRKDEAWNVCREALQAVPESLNTRELAPPASSPRASMRTTRRYARECGRH